MNQTIVENLNIFDEFVRSDNWTWMQANRDQPEIDNFLNDIMLRFDSVEFFVSTDVQRATLESNILSSKISEFLGYK
jgi:hypothetical protein